MRHLKTKLGIFWIIEEGEDLENSVGESHRYFLGFEDSGLAEYEDPELAAQDVYLQRTGNLVWDSQSKINIPEHFSQWQQGQPPGWS